MSHDSNPLPRPYDLLPHRYPFLLLDKIIEYSPGMLKAVKYITYNEHYFQGHFPNLAIVPGVLLIEMMAQASAALYRIEHHSQDESPPKPGRLASVEKIRFFKEVQPGEILVIETQLMQRIGGLAKFNTDIRVDKNCIAKGVLILVSPQDKLPSGILLGQFESN